MSRSFPSNRGSSACPWYTVGGKMNDKNLERRTNFKFCVKIGKSASQTLAPLTVAYGEYTMKKSCVFDWHRRFEEGREAVQDDPRSGQPKEQRTDANVDRVRTNGESTVLFGKCWQGYGHLFGGKDPNSGLYHDNAPAHDTFLAKKSITKLDHPLYSPDLVPCDFWLSKITKCPEGTKIC
jgi:hypothetical protein